MIYRPLADEIANRPEYNLYQVLYEIFTVQSLSSDQLDILELPWMRIYTTNYDDVVEYALLKHKSRISSYSYDEKKPRKLLPTSVVHLHGAIRQTTEDNVCEQLVLNEHSYVRQHFERSPWYDEFVRDIRYSTNCFFIGYSLSDYHISALLFQEEHLRNKTIFITREADVIFQNRVEKYGSVLPIGTNGFSNLCTNLPRKNRLENPFSLKSLRYIDPFKDKKTLAPPTSIEVLNLVTYGVFNEQRGMASLPSSTYIIPRCNLSEQAYR